MKTVEVYRMIASLEEQVGDNKIDHMAEAIRRSVDIEIDMFVASLLNSMVNDFGKSYTNPQYEGFRMAMQDIEQRYRVMDGMERQDLFQKIENIFKGIFLQKFNALGPEAAELAAVRYAGQMIKKIKESYDNSAQPVIDLYPVDNELVPATDMSKVDPAIHPNIPTYRNVY